jgi:serine protease AprX
MKVKLIIGLLVVGILAWLIGAAGRRGATVTAATWQSKVDPWVLATAAGGDTEFIILLRQQADLSGAAALPTKIEKGTYVFEQLTAVASRTQPALLAELERHDASYRPYWVANMVWVRGSAATIELLANRDDVGHIYANPWVRLVEPSAPFFPENPAAPDGIEWNVLKVNAPEVWARGVTGAGAVIAGQDTGYQWDHPALKNQYRGWNGVSADHNYNWHDAIHENNPNTPSGNPCGFNAPAPCDDNNHGTHTMGTMVGDDGGSNQIGVAPAARWIGCRNMEQGWGTPTTYSECFQWFIAPADLAGQNADPALAPHVVNNSWSCPANEGCTDPNVLRLVVENTRAAGIVVVTSAGNSGSTCSSVQLPPAIYEASFTVGATDSSDNIAGFSSRGPVTVDGSNRLKPEISAPGSGVRSSIRDGSYSVMSGTSMAAPHVAGLVGLLVSANPRLAGQVTLIESRIKETAVPRTTAQTCGSIPGSQVPNNTYGYGRIDSLAAYELVAHELQLSKTATSSQIAPGQLLTYTLVVTHNQPLALPTTQVVLTDVLPAGTSFVTATLPHTLDGTTITWSRDTLPDGESWLVELITAVTMINNGVISNDNYSVASEQVNPVAGTPVTTTVVAHELGLHKQVSASVIQAGEPITYTLTVTNQHPFAAGNQIVLSDSLPLHTTFVSASQPYTLDGATVQWQTATLAAGAAWTVTLVVQTNPAFVGLISNENYSAGSSEVSTLSGPPVISLASQYRFYLPWINK